MWSGVRSEIRDAFFPFQVAKKLIRTGAITAIQKSVEKDKTEKFRGFKRSQGEPREDKGC